MANLKEIIEWVDGIYQLETTDPVMGGPNGIDNLQAKQLGNRTQFLKKSLEDLADKVTNVDNSIPTVPVQSVNGKTGDINITAADVNALTREQALNEFLPASKKIGSDEQPLYEVGESVEFKKRPNINNSDVISLDLFTNNLESSGYQKLPSGLVIQWGMAAYKEGHGLKGGVCAFYTAFPNCCLSIVANDGYAGVNSVAVYPISTTQFRCWAKNSEGRFSDTGFFYIAIGY